jgi:hypothetical protein
VRGPKVRLRGLSEIATNPPRLIAHEQLDEVVLQSKRLGGFAVDDFHLSYAASDPDLAVVTGHYDDDPASSRDRRLNTASWAARQASWQCG